MVTGGAGFIGSHIVDLLLLNQYDVVVIDNLSTGRRRNLDKKVKFYHIDIRSEEINNIFQKEKPDYLIHHAAQIKVQTSIENPKLDADINIMGTLNLLEAAIRSGVKKIIYPASAAIYGEPCYLPIDEMHPIKMCSGYGVSKQIVESYLNVYKRIHGLDYVSLRYSNVYGPRQNSSGEGGVVSVFVDKLLHNESPKIYGTGEQSRDFIYVGDVAKANLLALESEIEEGIFNVSSNQSITISSLLEKIQSATNCFKDPVYKNEREGDIKHSLMCNLKINNYLGWKPQVDIDEGIKSTVSYYLINSGVSV
ncbi:NAD-dependent epimerase/dehydratase family protein [Paenibacillus solani]|nr:NAD-dependent epimerase/dehydratase family protein [Paenibacillus solani]